MLIDKLSFEDEVNKGLKLFENNKLEEAIKVFNKLKEYKETKVYSIFLLGIIQIKKKNLNLAKDFFYQALRLDKNHEDSNLNLGLVYLEEKQFDKAKFFFEKVLNINEKNLNAVYHLGLVFFFKKELDKAVKYLNKSIEVNEKYLHSYVTLGHIFLRQKNFDQAIKNYNKVLEIDPKNIKINFNLSWCYFAKSNLEIGFEKYEFRPEKISSIGIHKDVNEKYGSKEWNGENLDGKTILIIREQGYGDNINFFRYLYWLKETYKANIIFFSHKKLEYLFRNSPFKIITDLNEINHVDYYKHLLSLPGMYFKKLKGFQKNINYIKINDENNSKWEKKLNNFRKPIISLNWQGDHRFIHDDMRSIPLSNFKNILNINNLNFISLQKGFGSEQIKLNGYEKIITDFSNEIDIGNNAFEDTISILNKVNCVITSDTAIAHLAGVLDVKTYLLLSYNPEWRWHVELRNKCFYPNINIIQQSNFGDWDSVFKELELKLRESFL